MSTAILSHFELYQYALKKGKDSAMDFPNRIRELRENKGLSQDKLAEALNTSRGQVYQLEKGLRKLTQPWMVRLSKVFLCKPEDLISSGISYTVPVLGYVGTGERVIPLDDLPLLNLSELREKDLQTINCEFVESPENGACNDMVALRVRGDSMEPFLQEGSLIFYSKVLRGNYDEIINKPVVACLKDGSVYVKILRRGFGYGKYNLASTNTPKAIEDAEIAWCARIAYTKMA